MKNFIELLFHEVFKILINSKNEIQNSKNSIKNQIKNFTFCQFAKFCILEGSSCCTQLKPQPQNRGHCVTQPQP